MNYLKAPQRTQREDTFFFSMSLMSFMSTMSTKSTKSTATKNHKKNTGAPC